MYKLLILVFGVTILTSCVNKKDGEKKTGLLSNFISITNNEDKGVKEILGFYGGQCKYAVGFFASTDEENKKYFELEVSKSEVIQKQANFVQLPASNVAYLFYKNLKDEKNNYDEIHTVIIFNNGDKRTFKYSTKQLALVDNKMKLANKVVSYLKDKNYEALRTMLNNTALIQYDKNELITNLEKVDPQFGNIAEFRPFGFKINETESGKEILHISGVIIRDIQNNEFSIDVDLNSDNEEIFILEYKL